MSKTGQHGEREQVAAMGVSKSEMTPLLTPAGARLVRIERMLRCGQSSLEDMRASLHVSTATLKRDLQCLRDELGAPVQYDRHYNVYRFTGPWHGIAAEIFGKLDGG